MTYGYIRVSTDMQDTENQKLGINEKAKQLGLTVDEWISDDGVSGAKEPEKRLLGKLLKKVKENDVIITSEISRLGRQLFMVFRILEGLLEKGVKLYSVKDGYNLDNSITSKVLAFAFGMASEIERDMIRKRTKESLRIRKANGVILGRPVGSSTGVVKKNLYEKKDFIENMLKMGASITKLAKKVKCHRLTLAKFIKQENLFYDRKPYSSEKSKETQRQKSKKQNKLLYENIDFLKELMQEGKTLHEMTAILQEKGISSRSPSGVKNFIMRENLYEFWVKHNALIRLEKNVNTKDYNPEKIKQHAGL